MKIATTKVLEEDPTKEENPLATRSFKTSQLIAVSLSGVQGSQKHLGLMGKKQAEP